MLFQLKRKDPGNPNKVPASSLPASVDIRLAKSAEYKWESLKQEPHTKVDNMLAQVMLISFSPWKSKGSKY